jgi:FkbM family methyltransferase
MLRPWRRRQDLVIRDREGSVFLVPSLAEPIALHLFADGVYESEVAAFLQDHLRPGGVFVDVGANIGVFTLLAARRVGPAGKVIAVEASPRVFSYLEHNVRANGLTNVSLKHTAASHQESPGVPFYDAPLDHFGMGALSPQFNAQPTPVRARKLDAILAEEKLGRVDLMKLDVEGFEADVFRGASQLLAAETPPLIVFEFLDWAKARMPNGKVGDAQRILRDCGYTLWRLDDFMKNRPPLTQVLTEGSAMLVAARTNRPLA